MSYFSGRGQNNFFLSIDNCPSITRIDWSNSTHVWSLWICHTHNFVWQESYLVKMTVHLTKLPVILTKCTEIDQWPNVIWPLPDSGIGSKYFSSQYFAHATVVLPHIVDLPLVYNGCDPCLLSPASVDVTVLGFFSDPQTRVLCVCANGDGEPLVVTFNLSTRLHSIWSVKRATQNVSLVFYSGNQEYLIYPCCFRTFLHMWPHPQSQLWV